MGKGAGKPCGRDDAERMCTVTDAERQPIIDRIDAERKKCAGRWHNDKYWLGWTDAMRRCRRIVDGTIDDEPMYSASTEAQPQYNYAVLKARLRLAFEADSLDNHGLLIEAANAIEELQKYSASAESD